MSDFSEIVTIQISGTMNMTPIAVASRMSSSRLIFARIGQPLLPDRRR